MALAKLPRLTVASAWTNCGSLQLRMLLSIRSRQQKLPATGSVREKRVFVQISGGVTAASASTARARPKSTVAMVPALKRRSELELTT